MRIIIGTFQSRKQDRIRRSQEDREWRAEHKVWRKNHPELNERKKTKEEVKTMIQAKERVDINVSQEELETLLSSNLTPDELEVLCGQTQFWKPITMIKQEITPEERVMEGVNVALKKIDDAHCRMFKSLHDLRVAKAELDYLLQSDAYQQMLKRRVIKERI